jgi:hypothetical protein
LLACGFLRFEGGGPAPFIKPAMAFGVATTLPVTQIDEPNERSQVRAKRHTDSERVATDLLCRSAVLAVGQLQAGIKYRGALRHIDIDLKHSRDAAEHPVIADDSDQFHELPIAEVLARKVEESV